MLKNYLRFGRVEEVILDLRREKTHFAAVEVWLRADLFEALACEAEAVRLVHRDLLFLLLTSID